MSHDNLVGQVLGQYELRELLGLGGMGAVYRGFQISLKREVAVKVLPSTLVHEAGYVERFNREAQTAAQLEHPHIVSIFDYGTQQETSYLVMRLLTGGTLAQRLNQRTDAGTLILPSLGETATLVNQLGSALAYAHNQGVIHRDIKTSNVMFDNQGNGYLVDFGIAKLMGAQSGLTGTGMAMGTPAYMPPEQWAGRELTPAADQYALAVLVYAMVTGRVPFEAATPYELLHKHLHEQPTPPHSFRADLPDAVDIVLARALSKEPEQRFPSVTAFTMAFEAAIEGSKGDATAFFSTKIPLPRITRSAMPAMTPTPGGMAPSRVGSGSQPSIIAPPPSQPVNVTQQIPLHKNPIAYGVLIAILLLAGILVVLLNGSNNNNNVVADISASPGALEVIASDTSEPTATQTDTPESTSEPTSTTAPTATDTATVTTAPTQTATDEPTATTQLTATSEPSATSTSAAPTEQSALPEIALAIADVTFNPDSGIISLAYTDTGAPEIDRYEVEIVDAQTDAILAESQFIPNANGTAAIRTDALPAGEYEANLTALDASGQIIETSSSAFTVEGPATATPTETETSIPTETATNTPEPTATSTETPTNTPEPTATATDTPTNTPEPTATETPTNTPEPTATPTETATNTPEPTATPTPDFDALVLAFHSRRDGTNSIYLMDENGENVTQITHNEFSQTEPDWSPDGAKIVYLDTNGGQTEIWVMNRDGSAPVQLTDNDETESGPVWSPDGQYIAFASDMGSPQGSDIYVMRADGSDVVQLTNALGFDHQPQWSPDGTKIVFTTSRRGSDDIAVMDFNGANQRLLTDDIGVEFQPAWYPDGTKIIYHGYVQGYDLYSITLDGETTERLTNDDVLEEIYPVISPDGRFVIFESLRAEGGTFYDLWRMDLNDGTLVQLTNNTDDSSVSWRRDAGSLAGITPLPEIEPGLGLATATPAPTSTPVATEAPAATATAESTATPEGTAAPTVFMSIGTQPILVYNDATVTSTATSVSGARVPVTGVSADNEFYQIVLRDRLGWVQRRSTGYRIEGDISTLPITSSIDPNGESSGGSLTAAAGFLQAMVDSEFDNEIESLTSTGWELSTFNEDTALCSLGLPEGALLTLGSPEWDNYEVSAEVQYRGAIDGQFTIITRMTDDGAGIRHRMNGNNGEISQFTFRPGSTTLGMGAFRVNIRAGQWGVLRAEVDDSKIRTFFDGLLISEYDFFGGRFTSGYVGLEASANTRICLNNVTVRSMNRTSEGLANSVPVGDVLTSANLRLSDGAGYSRVGAASAGQVVFVLDENSDGSWYYIRIDRSRNPFEGWVTSSAVSIRD